MRLFTWLLRATIFFVLFAFALNNQHDVQLFWFFGYGWHAPMVFVVLAAFGMGCVVTLLALLPGWWRLRRKAQAADPVVSELPGSAATRRGARQGPVPDAPATMPPRDGL
ncbi:MAG: lipopolysaccharide assembly LapA domain-containing protein [Leptothrix sp. (in: b-proteobacteria)]